MVGVSALERVVKVSSTAQCAVGGCCHRASTPLSTTRCVYHMTCTNQPTGRSVTARAADHSGRCRSGQRYMSEYSVSDIVILIVFEFGLYTNPWDDRRNVAC